LRRPLGHGLDDLARKLDQGARLLILCSPHNPVGRVWTRENSRSRPALQERDVLVVSDEIHADIVFKPHRHVPFALLSPNLAGRTITCWAPSKAFNLPGLNTSFVVAANRKLLDLYRLESQRAGFEMGNVFGLTALEAAYTHGAEWLDEAIAYVAANADFAAEFIRAKLPVLDFIRPEGTFLGLFDCRRLGLDDKALGEFFLRRAKVYFNAGPRSAQRPPALSASTSPAPVPASPKRWKGSLGRWRARARRTQIKPILSRRFITDSFLETGPD